MSKQLTDKQLKALMYFASIEGKEIRPFRVTSSARLATGIPQQSLWYMTKKLIEEGYITREELPDKSVRFDITDKGRSYLMFVHSNPEEEEQEIEEQIEGYEEANDFEAKGNSISIIEDIKPLYVADEDSKDDAILATINEALIKTVDFCQTVFVEINKRKSAEIIPALQDRIKKLEREIAAYEAVVKKFDEKEAETSQFIKDKVGILKCTIDSRMKDFFKLVAWAQTQQRPHFMKDVMKDIDEFLGDIMYKLIEEADEVV